MSANQADLRWALETLHLDAGAGQSGVRKAFRKLVVQNRPDQFSDRREKIAAGQNISEMMRAYEILKKESFPLRLGPAPVPSSPPPSPMKEPGPQFHDHVIPKTAFSQPAAPPGVPEKSSPSGPVSTRIRFETWIPVSLALVTMLAGGILHFRGRRKEPAPAKPPAAQEPQPPAVQSKPAEIAAREPQMMKISRTSIKGLDRAAALFFVQSSAHLAPKDDEAVRDLGEALSHEDPAVKVAALKALDALGARGKGALPAVKKAYLDSDQNVRIYSAVVLAGLEKVPNGALPVFMAGLRHLDPQIRFRSALYLGDMGKKARKAVPSLKALLKDPDREVGLAAASALEKMGL